MKTRHQCIGLLAFVCLLAFGCSRHEYRRSADCNSYGILRQKTVNAPWHPPSNYSVYPRPESRLYQPTCIDCPELPPVGPKLYCYDLPLKASESATDGEDQESVGLVGQGADGSLVSPLPPSAWLEIPLDCRRRMFDFTSLRQEAENTEARFNQTIIDSAGESIPKLTLEEIIEQALLNSRDYQQQKENLYQVALQLSAERFAYALRPTVGGNGTDLLYSHERFGGQTVNGLSVPTGLGVRRALVTGGDFLAQFANSVILTFNGPTGFTSNVSSSLLFDITQPLLQRDIQFESLTQAERNVIYAARDFARFRKQFFVSFAADYYSLILDFRRVEIDSQNYFSLVRAFNQAEAEYRAGVVPRFQVDQVEQNLLQGRGRLIGTCNGIEQSLDQLKLAIGLPTETRINIDLSEINELTKRDQLAVSGDLINRVRRRLTSALSGDDRIEMLSTGTVLLNRLIEAGQLQTDLGQEEIDLQPLQIRRTQLQIATRRLTTQQIEDSLDRETNSESPSLPIIFQRLISVSESRLLLADRQLELAALQEIEPEEIEALSARADEAAEQINQLRAEFQQLIRDEQLRQFPQLVDSGRQLRQQVIDLSRELDQLTGFGPEREDTDESMEGTVAQMQDLLCEADQALAAVELGLSPIEIDVDEAMITALSLRFDLMNTREQLADRWRRIKYAADDLKSVLNLRATQRIRTEAGVNQPFNFTFDESSTDLALTFDAPLNRRQQRNGYRSSLFSYQQGLRNLMASEDSIKFSVRNDLRNLALDKEQYYIAVASAALAYERVVSTSLEFRLGTGGVTARDFLEAQTAYTNALTSVASQHIGYILDRTQLFLDLELLSVNEQGFWDELYDETYQPAPFLGIPPWASPVYGCLPDVWYSPEIKRMLCVPAGPAVICDQSIGNSESASEFGQETVPPVPAADPDASDSGSGEHGQGREPNEFLLEPPPERPRMESPSQ